jgi:hypothetical protein
MSDAKPPATVPAILSQGCTGPPTNNMLDKMPKTRKRAVGVDLDLRYERHELESLWTSELEKITPRLQILSKASATIGGQ